MTLLFVTHDVDEALLLADRIVLLSHRPATVADVITIDKPRTPEAQFESPISAVGAPFWTSSAIVRLPSRFGCPPRSFDEPDHCWIPRARDRAVAAVACRAAHRGAGRPGGRAGADPRGHRVLGDRRGGSAGGLVLDGDHGDHHRDHRWAAGDDHGRDRGRGARRRTGVPGIRRGLPGRHDPPGGVFQMLLALFGVAKLMRFIPAV